MGELMARVNACEGWSAERRRAGHWRVCGPRGALGFFAWSPSDYRALRNARSWLRRAGFRGV